MHTYGIDIKTLEKFITVPVGEKSEWGEHMVVVHEPMYRMEKVVILPGQTAELVNTDDFETTAWVEEGEGVVQGVPLLLHHAITIPSRMPWKFEAKVASVLYLFCGPASDSGNYMQPGASFDFRDKYWGTIESIVSKEYAAKRMLVKKSKYASLEYHCNKTETYYIHSGMLLHRLRAGRAEDRFFTLEQGMAALTPPGLMHQRGGLEDTVIIEISTKDDDADSFLVEDGQKTPMPNIDSAA